MIQIGIQQWTSKPRIDAIVSVRPRLSISTDWLVSIRSKKTYSKNRCKRENLVDSSLKVTLTKNSSKKLVLKIFWLITRIIQYCSQEDVISLKMRTLCSMEMILLMIWYSNQTHRMIKTRMKIWMRMSMTLTLKSILKIKRSSKKKLRRSNRLKATERSSKRSYSELRIKKM